MAILRLSTVPKMNYLTRTMRPDVLRSAAEQFDRSVLDTARNKLRLPDSSTDEAKLSLTLPIREGGFGLRSMTRVSPAAYWSALAQAAPELLADALTASTTLSPATTATSAT